MQVPEEWRTFFYNWEPQIWYFLQQFAWVRRSEEYAKQVSIQFALTSQMTADLKVKTPDATAERNDLSLPMKIERFPSSLQEIKNSFYGKTFSQLHNSFSKSCGNCNNFGDVNVDLYYQPASHIFVCFILQLIHEDNSFWDLLSASIIKFSISIFTFSHTISLS